MRTFKLISVENFFKMTERRLCQFYIGRVLFGRVYVEFSDVWTPVEVLQICEDGTRFFIVQDTGEMFHETLRSIKCIQEFV